MTMSPSWGSSPRNALFVRSLPLMLIFKTSCAFSSGQGFGKSPNNAFVSFDRFRSTCPEDINAVKQFEPTLISGDNTDSDDVWVAVYRSNNNLPNVFVRDAFFDAMKTSTTMQEGDSETLVSSSSTSISGRGVVVSAGTDGANKPVAVARLTRSSESPNVSIIDSMRCSLKKEDTDPECDGGSEHAEAIGICIDELVLYFLEQHVPGESNGNGQKFDGCIRFRGTLVSGKLLEARGFREVTELSADMHSHESDYFGALTKYAERSTSKSVAKNPGGRERALKIVSYLGRFDKDEESNRAEERNDENDGGYDPWASIKKYI